MSTFSQRKQQARVARRQQHAVTRYDGTLRGQIATQVLGVEFRLRGFFPSHQKVYAMIDERLHGEWQRLEKLRDDCVVLLDELAKASDDALKRGDIVSRHRMNKAVRRG